MFRANLILTLCLLLLSGCNDIAPKSQPEGRDVVKLHPDYPVVDGAYQMTKNWSVDLPSQFNRRIEDGSLVIWRPGFTMWIEAYGNDDARTNEDRVDEIRADSSPDRYDEMTESEDDLIRYSYRLSENEPDSRRDALYCFAVAEAGHIMMAIYFDDTDDITYALKIWRSISPRKHAG